MADHETDETVFETIKRLVDEEHALWDRPESDAAAQTKLETIRVELDRYWGAS